MLSSELQKAKYQDYLENLSLTIGSLSAIHIFSDITELLKSVLTNKQIYDECAALEHKLALLAAEFCLTHVTAILPSLIQQVEQANSNNVSQTQNMIHNLLQANARGRCTKRLKASMKIIPKSSKNKMIDSNIHFGDVYICRNCLKKGYNARSCNASCMTCKEVGHTYLHYKNREGV
ncbi:14304_t:CDS:2 [Cetraspora pellucida]|uniref:14304_t:CDS:1 n=1 Tax=Cetraspora pellucida TaxID=1433469 RepID=A0ACA9MBF6_9GLOM|nr:14304_t:CDS:2 [Cetraspora pellucida]